ncbi:MoaD/ThiS family protein [Luteococcus sanguinis]|uniref:MoaD/ThiS family protein n=1 Tax=Luteococcus sanguinis TaxID=174038 RepID=A0ABW1X1X2_9ACTN
MQVRWFAGAAEAAGVEAEELSLAGSGTIAEVLGAHRPGTVSVLGRCSFLVDGVRQAGDAPWPSDAGTIDVLPPFVGG